MRRFWRDGTAEFHGEFWDFGPTGMYPAPGRPVPLWIGGRSDAALRRAARNDGWVGMNYDSEEIPVLLAKLARERRRHVEEGGASGPFETLVLSNAAPSPALYRDLEAQGVSSTIGIAWPLGDPAFAPFERKRAAMEAFGAANHLGNDWDVVTERGARLVLGLGALATDSFIPGPRPAAG